MKTNEDIAEGNKGLPSSNQSDPPTTNLNSSLPERILSDDPSHTNELRLNSNPISAPSHQPPQSLNEQDPPSRVLPTTNIKTLGKSYADVTKRNLKQKPKPQNSKLNAPHRTATVQTNTTKINSNRRMPLRTSWTSGPLN